MCELISFTNFNAQFLYSLTICMLHYNLRHVSSSNMPIFRRTNCSITASGIVTLCKRLYSMLDESRLCRVCPQCHALATLPLGKTWYPLYGRLGGPQGRSGRVQKFSSPLGFNSWSVQPVASLCTDCAISAPGRK